ncbi:MAG TPA: FAD-dependent oxidoreductase [Syntrophales bacterium]|nr:FAD-dependent oxidoreductase [Syntrophales bacterium]
MARTPEKFRESGVDVRIRTRVDEIDVKSARVRLNDGSELAFDILVLGTGTLAIRPEIPGTDLPGVFALKKLEEALAIKAYIAEKDCRNAVIVGAGFIAMEMCEALRARGIETTVVHRGALPVNRWDPEFGKLIVAEMGKNGVTFLANVETRAIEEGAGQRLRLVTSGGDLDADLVILAVGVRPDTALAKAAGVPLGRSGAVAVDFSQRTAMEGIYAVGDCCESYHRVSRSWVHVPLGDIANKQGRVAGANIGGKAMIFPGIVGAQSFKVFGLEVAAAGIGEREAAAAGYHPVSVLIWGNAIAPSMPAAKKVGIKLVADRASGKLLGAQALGEAGAVGRINALACALWAGLGVDEIGYLDFAYAPPFSPAWDPIHVAAQTLRRKL